MSTDPVTPRKPPPFQARLSKGPPTPVTPSRDDRLGLFLPPGNELILRGVYCPGTAVGDPVPIVEKLLKQLQETNETLKDIPVVVKPYSTYPKSISSTICYLRLHPIFDPIAIEGTDAEPRCDLLSEWMVAIEAAQPKWEVRWSPQKAGRDKRLWVRFPKLVAKGSGQVVPVETVAKIKMYLQGRGFPVVNHFTNPGGPVMEMADPDHVDQIIAQVNLQIPTISSDDIFVSRVRQIEIRNAFELVVMGIGEYDGLPPHLTAWFRGNFSDGDTTLFCDSRTLDDEPDAFIFYMRDWESTKRVLSAHEEFYNQFKTAKSLIAPQLLWNLNSNGIWRKDLRSDFQQGAQGMNDGLAAIGRRLDNFERQVKGQGEALQIQLNTVAASVSTLSTSVGQIGLQMVNHQQAMIVANEQGATRGRISAIQIQITSERGRYRMAMDEEEKAEAKIEVKKLEDELSKANEELTHLSDGFTALLGRTDGLLIEPPAATTNQVTTSPPGLSRQPTIPTLVPATTRVSAAQLSHPLSPSPPSRREGSVLNRDANKRFRVSPADDQLQTRLTETGMQLTRTADIDVTMDSR